MSDRRVDEPSGPNALDFWFGEWDCKFEGGRATNLITREYGGHVVVERFQTIEDEPFDGFSVSVYTPATNAWRQTWVDSAGNYWAFVGAELPDGAFEFRTPTPVDAEEKVKRMVFWNIEPDAFDWRWEFSADGTTWERKWEIHYHRR